MSTGNALAGTFPGRRKLGGQLEVSNIGLGVSLDLAGITVQGARLPQGVLSLSGVEAPRGDGYRRMIEVSAAGRAGTPDEVGAVGALLMGADGAFITGSDFLMDGGVTAAYWYGELAPR